MDDQRPNITNIGRLYLYEGRRLTAQNLPAGGQAASVAKQIGLSNVCAAINQLLMPRF
jgi:hypothetical protein